MGTWSDSERNAAAERELDNDLDHYFESMEDGPEVEQTFTVSVDVCVKATSKDEAKRIALLCVESHAVLSDAVVLECLSEGE